MTETTTLLNEISSLIDQPGADRDLIERTLTDGYAHALLLESERLRMQKRRDELAHGLTRGDAAEKAKELMALAHSLDGNAGELARLRETLAELRRKAS